MRAVRSPVRWLVGPPPETVGKEPDPRFSYANERTFLAWNRTALALISVGLAVTNLLPPFHLPPCAKAARSPSPACRSW